MYYLLINILIIICLIFLYLTRNTEYHRLEDIMDLL